MSKKSDDSIDRIFRQALTQYDTKFHADDWLKMEKMLEEEAQRKAAARSRRIKGTAYTLTGLTGLFIVVYFLAIKNPSGSIAILSDSVTEMQASEALTDNGNVKHENPSEGLLSQPTAPDASSGINENGRDAAQGIDDVTDYSSGEVDSKGNPSDKNVPFNPQNDLTGHDRSSEPGNQKNDSAPLPEQIPKKRSTSQAEFEPDEPGLDPTNKSNPSLTSPEKAENVEATGDRLSKNEDGLGQTNLTSGKSGKVTLSTEPEDILEDAQSPKVTSPSTGPNNEVPATNDSTSSEIITKAGPSTDTSSIEGPQKQVNLKAKPDSRWSVAFVIAPEFSTTSLSSYSTPGDSYGLRIGYQLSNRLSINTGLVRSQKKYEGSGEGYEPRNPAYWNIRTNGVVPDEIVSKCLVYELPLGLQYDAIQTSKSRLFVSTAISSYFMINQAYDYTFHSPNPGADMGWRSRGSESYWFSVGMVSAGYERYVTRSFAIGIEPYLKISLAEIGWPNIKLYSTGAHVTLRYKFLSRRNF